MAEGRVDGDTNGVDTAEGREDGGRGANDGRGAGVAVAGLDDGRGAGVEARGAGAELEARGAGAGVDGDAATWGSGAGPGIASPPHSASMSSVGGAIDGIGGRPLTRSLSDRLSVIALSGRLFTAGCTNQELVRKGPALRVLNGRFRSS